MIIQGIILFIALHLFSGYFFSKLFLKKESLFESISVSAILSLFATPAIFTLLAFIFGFDVSLIALPLLLTSMAGAGFWRKKGKMPKVHNNKPIIGRIKNPPLIIAVCFSIFLLALFFLGLPEFAFSRITDSHFHAAAVNEIRDSKSLPPDTACLPGEKLRYSWFPHLMVYLVSQYSGLSTYTIFSFYGIYLFILFASSTYLLGRVYFNSNTAAMSALMIILFSYFYSSFFLFSTQGYSLPVIALFFFSMIKSFRDEDKKYKIFSGLLAGSLVYIHGLSFVFSLIVLAPIIIYSLLDIGLRPKSPFYYLLPLGISIPFYLLTPSGAGGLFLFQPLSGLFLFISQLQYFNILLVILPFAAANAIKNKEKGQPMLLLSLFAVFAFVMLFVMPRNPNIYRNIFLSIFPLSLFTLYAIQKSTRIKIAAVAFAVAAPWIFVYADDLKNTFSAENFYNLPQYSASVWAGNNSSTQDRILAAPNPLYSGASARKMVVCSDDFLRGWAYDPHKLKSNFGDALSIFSNPSQQLLEKHKIKYIVYGDDEKKFLEKYDIQPFDFAASPEFAAEYKSGNYTVYSVKDIKSLPEKPQTTFNFTSYSRWWEI